MKWHIREGGGQPKNPVTFCEQNFDTKSLKKQFLYKLKNVTSRMGRGWVRDNVTNCHIGEERASKISQKSVTYYLNGPYLSMLNERGRKLKGLFSPNTPSLSYLLWGVIWMFVKGILHHPGENWKSCWFPLFPSHLQANLFPIFARLK